MSWGQCFKAWLHQKTAPEGLDHTPSGHQYSTSVRIEPVNIPLELAFVPRFPPKPVDCSDELFEEVLEAVRKSLKGDIPDGRIIYHPRQRELYITFPDTLGFTHDGTKIF